MQCPGHLEARLLFYRAGASRCVWINDIYPKLNNYASSGLGFLKKLAMDGWFAGAAGPFFDTSLGL